METFITDCCFFPKEKKIRFTGRTPYPNCQREPPVSGSLLRRKIHSIFPASLSRLRRFSLRKAKNPSSFRNWDFTQTGNARSYPYSSLLRMKNHSIFHASLSRFGRAAITALKKQSASTLCFLPKPATLVLILRLAPTVAKLFHTSFSCCFAPFAVPFYTLFLRKS